MTFSIKSMENLFKFCANFMIIPQVKFVFLQ